MLDTNNTNAFDKWRQGVDWRVDLILTADQNSEADTGQRPYRAAQGTGMAGCPCL